GNQRRTRGRAKRSGVKHVVTQSCLRQLVVVGGGNRSSKRGRGTKAHIIGHDEQHVWSALGRFDSFGKVRCRFLCRAADLPVERRLGLGQRVGAAGWLYLCSIVSSMGKHG